MGIYRSFAGTVRVRILAADVPSCLRMLEGADIAAFSVLTEDSVTLEVTVPRRDIIKLQKLCQRKGYSIAVVNKKGIFWLLQALLHRPVLVAGMILFLITACYIPGRIMFISTEGNDTVSSRHILEQAENCGLKFWTRRRDVRSEQVKNELLEAIPQLQWVGVNTYGCKAIITVRERASSKIDEPKGAVSHIAAARDGVIRSCTITRGSSYCVVGQAVRKGDILISGYTDCGLIYTAERAEGDILAQTQRSVSIITPSECLLQRQTDRTDTRFSLVIGKKRINFYKGSGISGATCDKMYSKYVLTLPGGFSLPVVLLKERTVSCSLTETAIQNPESMLQHLAADYLIEQMADGTVENKSESLTETDGVFRLTGAYDCLENIGIVQEEKIGEYNGETGGADRERRPGG